VTRSGGGEDRAKNLLSRINIDIKKKEKKRKKPKDRECLLP
jgi:hypothetical protein